ncbi:flagellar hook-length control protein FliK [Clostridium estertheticum]|uniref:flagellar hook-length control protein FliK n=1 Tax=Clostridium estertheticum TaxID=238834 RepID=UPI0013E8F902|nr:flagellar hook-length control protein FliK [Clostridium estertheticum]MBZ9688077.1 flagellar hook-length control protein FliK [Clostridium estertheticum]
MNVNMNVMTNTTSKKQEAPKASNRSEDFKKVLDNHELKSVNSSNENVQKKYNKDEDDQKVNNKDEDDQKVNKGEDDQKVNEGNLEKTNNENQRDEVANKDVESVDIEKSTVESSTPKDLKNSEANVELKSKIINLIEVAIDKLKQTSKGSSSGLESTDKSRSQMAQLQQLLQLLSSMFLNVPENSATINVEGDSNSINLESLMGSEQLIDAAKLMSGEELTSDAKGILKNDLTEIISMLEKSKGKELIPSQISDMLQKLTTVTSELKKDLSLLKVPNLQALNVNIEDKSIKDNLLKKIMQQSTKDTSETIPKVQLQSSNDSSKESKFSGNSSSEEKFLNNLLGKDKDEMKITKAVNFMNQFETVKATDTAKVQTINTIIDKSSFTVDVIKNIKFMEINNIKDLTVKMNPKELGEITIKLTMESGIMKASISAQNKDTFNLLNGNLQDISDKLKNMDIKIQSLDINIYEDSTFFNKDSNEKNNNGSKNNNSGTNSGLEEEAISVSNNYAIEENQVNKFV